MNYREAREMFEPTSLPANVIPLNRAPMSAERIHIENKIRQHEAEIARHAQAIRWLKLELES